MATLAQLSSSNNPQKGTTAVQILLQNSPLLAFLNATSGFELVPHDYQFRPVIGSSSAPSRAEGGSYTPGDLAPEALQSASLKMHGDGVDIDVSRLADASNGLVSMDSWYLNAVKAKLLAFAKSYEALLFNGAGTTTLIKGLKVILDGSTDVPGFTGVKRVWNAAEVSTDNSPKSLDITVSATNYDKNIKKLIELINTVIGNVVNAKGILASSSLVARLTTIAGDRGITANVSTMIDGFGKQVTLFNGVPIIPMLPNSILSTEPDDTTTPLEVTTSLYVLSPAEMQFSLATNSGLAYWAYDALQAKESAREKWEIRAGWKIEDQYSVARIRNIKI